MEKSNAARVLVDLTESFRSSVRAVSIVDEFAAPTILQARIYRSQGLFSSSPSCLSYMPLMFFFFSGRNIITDPKCLDRTSVSKILRDMAQGVSGICNDDDI